MTAKLALVVPELPVKNSSIRYPNGHSICREGQPADGAYLLLSGLVLLLHDNAGAEGQGVALGLVRKGETFGDEVLSGVARETSAITVGQVEVDRFTPNTETGVKVKEDALARMALIKRLWLTKTGKECIPVVMEYYGIVLKSWKLVMDPAGPKPKSITKVMLAQLARQPEPGRTTQIVGKMRWDANWVKV